MIQALIQALQTGGLALTAEEYADLIWLAAQLTQPGKLPDIAIVKTLASATARSVSTQSADQLDTSTQHEEPPPSPQDTSGDARPQQATQAEVHLPQPSPAENPQVSGIRGVSFRAPAATALPDKLAIGRSLRPLMRRVPSRHDFSLDEEATAEHLAAKRTFMRSLQPVPELVLAPIQERWLEVALIVDEWSTMVIWQQTVTEFQELLAQLGAFRNVQRWSLITTVSREKQDDETVDLMLRTNAGPSGGASRACDPLEVSDPSGQRLVLVLSDCSSPAWSSGDMARLLHRCAAHNLVTIIQMLPEYLWETSALAEAVQIQLSAAEPGANNSRLKVDLPWHWLDISPPAGVSMPVITLEPEALGSWARLVAGLGKVQVPGIYLPMAPVESLDEEEGSVRLQMSPEERWERFRTTASPTARELAGYLAAAPLSLPVMRLVQTTMLPNSRQVHLAEVFRSGLIKRLTPYEPMMDPNEIRYDFVEGIRKLLMTTVLVSDTKKVLEEVSHYVSRHDSQLRNFHALILDPTATGDFNLDEEHLPFATVTAAVLQRLGGQFAQLATRLEGYLRQVEDVAKVTIQTSVFHEAEEHRLPKTELADLQPASITQEKEAVKDTDVPTKLDDIPPIEGVETAVTAFIGFTERAEAPTDIDPLVTYDALNKPIPVNDWTEFTRYFGGFVEGTFLPYVVHGFFSNGGRKCYIISVKTIKDRYATAVIYDGDSYQNIALIIEARLPGADGNGLQVWIEEPSLKNGTFSLRVEHKYTPVEEFHNLTMSNNDENVLDVVNTSSQFIQVKFASNIDIKSLGRPTPGIYSLTGGRWSDLKIDNNILLGSTEHRQELGNLATMDDVRIVCMPDLAKAHMDAIIDDEQFLGIQKAILDHCQLMGDRIAILDTPYNVRFPQEVSNWRMKIASYDSSYGVLYYPWVTIKRTSLDGSGITWLIPPCGHVAGIYARVDNERGVHVASINEPIRGVIEPALRLTREEQDSLRSIGINTILTLTGRGTFIGGGRTLSSDPAWRFVHTRRIANFIQMSIQIGTQWVGSERNNAKTWERTRQQISTFLQRLWQVGTLVGDVPEEAFYVKCDEENNPAEIRDIGQFQIEVGIAPVESKKFIPMMIRHQI